MSPSKKSKAPRPRYATREEQRVDALPPTERQLKILSFMRAYQESRGAPPAIREIGAHFGIASTNGVSDHLRALHRKGLIRKHRGARRYVPVALAIPEQVAPPWDACEVAFTIDDPDAVGRANLAPLPAGWTLDGVRETPVAAGQLPQWIAVFRAPPAPSTEDGKRVLALLRAVAPRAPGSDAAHQLRERDPEGLGELLRGGEPDVKNASLDLLVVRK